MNRELLERPFETALVKTRKGSFGHQLSYVEGAEYIRRLNAAFDGRWSFEIVDHQIGKNHVVVVGKLTAAEIVKMAFGGSTITTNNQTGDAVSVADDLKSAATDAMKKAASMLGVGLDLYSSGDRTDKDVVPAVCHDSERSSSRSPSTASRPQRNAGNGRGNGNGQTNVRRIHAEALTSSQLNAIRAIARSREISAEELRRRSVKAFGVVPDRLTKTDASALIDELKQIPPTNQRGAS